MKKTYGLFILVSFFFFGCDIQGSYSFIVQNETQDTIDNNKNEITLLPEEEKLVRTIEGHLNVTTYDSLNKDGIR